MSNGASHQPEIKLLSRLLDATQRSYAEASDNWKLIETKAQATAAASGVFIAALFATILRDPLNLAGRVGVVLISAVFVAAFLLAVRSVLISEYQSPFESAANVADALRLVGQGDKTPAPTEPQWLASEVGKWHVAVESLDEPYKRKLRALQGAHVTFIAATVLLFLATTMQALTPSARREPTVAASCCAPSECDCARVGTSSRRGTPPPAGTNPAKDSAPKRPMDK